MTKSDTTSKVGSSGWHIALGKASASTEANPYLGDPLTVDGIVRSFVKDICDRYSEVADGGMFSQDAAELDKADCERLGRIFAGEDRSYTSVGEWNGEGVAGFCRKAMPEYLPDGGTPAETMAQVMAVLAREVYGIIGDVNDDGDAELAGLALNGRIEDWTRMLLGLPPEEG